MTIAPTDTFALEHTRAGGVDVIRAIGRLVAGVGADHPAWLLAGDGDGAAQVVIDLEGVTALDAGGLGRLLRLRQALARRGTRLTVGAAGPRVRRVLELTRLDAIFGIASSRAGQRASWPAADAAASLCRCA